MKSFTQRSITLFEGIFLTDCSLRSRNWCYIPVENNCKRKVTNRWRCIDCMDRNVSFLRVRQHTSRKCQFLQNSLLLYIIGICWSF